VIESGFGAQAGDRGAKSVDDRHAARCRQQFGQPRKRALARRAKLGANVGPAARLARRGVITEDGPIYRGVNCVDLAEKDTLEHAATLLWDVTVVDPFAPDNCPHVSDDMRTIAEAARRAAPIDRAIAVLALAASADPRAFTRAADGRAMVGARILRLLVATMLNTEASAEPLHHQIARSWAGDNKHAPDLIRRALVLLADHELNASTFTARVDRVEPV
jgi:citrate synthase